MEVSIRGKLLDGSEARAVVDKVLHTLPIFFGKVVCHRVQTLHHAFSYRHTGHHDDKLCPAIVFVELIHRLDVSVGLSRASLHLDAQCQRAVGIALHRLHEGKILLALYVANVGSERIVVEEEALIAKSHCLECQLPSPHVHAVGKGVLQRLSAKHLHHSLCGITLKRLMFVL